MFVCVCQAPFRSNPLSTEIIFHTYASGESLGFSEIAFASVKGERPGPFSHFPHRYKSSHTSPQLCPETELVYGGVRLQGNMLPERESGRSYHESHLLIFAVVVVVSGIQIEKSMEAVSKEHFTSSCSGLPASLNQHSLCERLTETDHESPSKELFQGLWWPPTSAEGDT